VQQARLLEKVCEDCAPQAICSVCPKCSAEMRVIALIEDPNVIKRFIRHLVKIGGGQAWPSWRSHAIAPFIAASFLLSKIASPSIESYGDKP